jgi:hypothetical protein
MIANGNHGIKKTTKIWPNHVRGRTKFKAGLKIAFFVLLSKSFCIFAAPIRMEDKNISE